MEEKNINKPEQPKKMADLFEFLSMVNGARNFEPLRVWYKTMAYYFKNMPF